MEGGQSTPPGPTPGSAAQPTSIAGFQGVWTNPRDSGLNPAGEVLETLALPQEVANRVSGALRYQLGPFLAAMGFHGRFNGTALELSKHYRSTATDHVACTPDDRRKIEEQIQLIDSSLATVTQKLPFPLSADAGRPMYLRTWLEQLMLDMDVGLELHHGSPDSSQPEDLMEISGAPDSVAQAQAHLLAMLTEKGATIDGIEDDVDKDSEGRKHIIVEWDELIYGARFTEQGWSPQKRISIKKLATLLKNGQEEGSKVVVAKYSNSNGPLPRWETENFDLKIAVPFQETVREVLANLRGGTSSSTRCEATEGGAEETIVLVTSGTRRGCIDDAIRSGMKVELWCWRVSLSQEQLQDDRLKVRLLDSVRSLITFDAPDTSSYCNPSSKELAALAQDKGLPPRPQDEHFPSSNAGSPSQTTLDLLHKLHDKPCDPERADLRAGCHAHDEVGSEEEEEPDNAAGASAGVAVQSKMGGAKGSLDHDTGTSHFQGDHSPMLSLALHQSSHSRGDEESMTMCSRTSGRCPTCGTDFEGREYAAPSSALSALPGVAQSEIGGTLACVAEDEVVSGTVTGTPYGPQRALWISPDDLIITLYFDGIRIIAPMQLSNIPFQATRVSPRVPLLAGVQRLTEVVELTPHEDFGMTVLVTLPLLPQLGKRSCTRSGHSLYFLVLEEESEKWTKVERGDFNEHGASLEMKGFCLLVGVEELSERRNYRVTIEAWAAEQKGSHGGFQAKALVYAACECTECKGEVSDQKRNLLEKGFVQCIENGRPMEESFVIKDIPSNGSVELRFQPIRELDCHLPKPKQFKGDLVVVSFASLPLDEQGGVCFSLGVGEEDDVTEVIFSRPPEHPPPQAALFLHGTSKSSDLASLPREWRDVERALPGSQWIFAEDASSFMLKLAAALDSGLYPLLILACHRDQDGILLRLDGSRENSSGKQGSSGTGASNAGYRIANEALERFLRDRWHKKPNPLALLCSTCGGGKLPVTLVDEGLILFGAYWNNLLIGKDNKEKGVPDDLAASFTGLYVQALAALQSDPSLQQEYLYAAAFRNAKQQLYNKIFHQRDLRAWINQCHCYPFDAVDIPGAGRAELPTSSVSRAGTEAGPPELNLRNDLV